MKERLKALDGAFLPTRHIFIYTHTSYIYTLPTATDLTKLTGAANPPALPTQAKQGCAETLGFASGWEKGKDSV